MRGVVACVAVLVLLTGCDVSIDAPDVGADTTKACRSFVGAVPAKVGDQSARDVSDPARGAAWGDPAIVLTCGVGTPKGFDRFSTCQETNGIGWYVPEDQLGDHPVDVTMTTIGRSPRLRVTVPRDYWPPTAVMADLATTVKQHTRRTGRCV